MFAVYVQLSEEIASPCCSSRVWATKDMISILLAACAEGARALPPVKFIQHSCCREYVMEEFDQVRPSMLVLLQGLAVREPVNFLHGGLRPLVLYSEIFS